MPRYEGPLIDAHHHLWEPSKGNYSWLLERTREALAKDVTPDNYAATFADFDIVGTVLIEGRPDDPLAEARQALQWRQTSQGTIATGFVAHCAVDAPNLRSTIDELRAANPNLTGVRDIVAHIPGKPSFARAPDLLKGAAFLKGLKVLEEEELVFDLMLEPHQLAEAHACFSKVPDLKLAIEHAGSPRDQTPEGLKNWRDGMARLAKLPNTVVKVSALQVHDPHWTIASLKRVFEPLTDLFGPRRMMMGTDFPVHDLACPGPKALEAFLDLTEGWPLHDQAAFFHGTAIEIYGLKIENSVL
ncbi:MAG: amidohydrolase family protein [Pseudomonadota bacterium]